MMDDPSSIALLCEVSIHAAVTVSIFKVTAISATAGDGLIAVNMALAIP
jgi:hypothetical protein